MTRLPDIRLFRPKLQVVALLTCDGFSTGINIEDFEYPGDTALSEFPHSPLLTES